MAEVVILVDRENREIGVAPRARMRAERLAHRATFVFVFRGTRELVVQRRTMTKDVYPGYLDLAAGGVVVAGESYDESAQRELAEELGIRGVPLHNEFEFWFEDEFVRVWGRVYTCRWDGDLRLQPEEVESVKFLRPEDVLSGRLGGPFTPDSLYALARLMERG